MGRRQQQGYIGVGELAVDRGGGCEGIDSLTVDHLAASAGVGKGTIFRAFGNRSGIATAAGVWRGARQLSAAHVRVLLRECGVHDNADVTVEALLGLLDAETAHHLITERHLAPQDLLAGWQQLVGSIVAAA